MAAAALVAVVALSVLVVVVVQGRGEDDGAAADIKQILDPLAGAADATDAVALVNGFPISKYRLEGTVATSGESREKVLDSLIDYELLYQEGVRLGLVATDEVVAKAIAQTRETASPALVKAAIELAREQGIEMDEETYWSHPLTIEATRKSLTVGAAREALLAGVEPQRRDETLAERLALLRSAADIEIRELVPEPSPTPDPAKWRNGTARCPMPLHVSVPPTGVERGDATQAFCVVWANEYPDESGFRVSVRYHEGGDYFEHTIPADEHDFVFPPAEAPILVGPECSARRSYTIEVFVIRPAGDEPVGAIGHVAECGLPR